MVDADKSGIAADKVDNIVKKAATLYAKYTLFKGKVLEPDEVLCVASLDSCSVVGAGNLKLRVFYSSIVL